MNLFESLRTNFYQRARDTRLYLLLSLFLWVGIYVGPFNIYFLILAAGLTLRGLIYLLNWYSLKNEIKGKLNSSLQNSKGEWEPVFTENEKRNIKFFQKSASNQFLFIISAYPIGIGAHFAELYSFKTLSTVLGFGFVFLLMGAIGMGTTPIEDV